MPVLWMVTIALVALFSIVSFSPLDNRCHDISPAVTGSPSIVISTGALNAENGNLPHSIAAAAGGTGTLQPNAFGLLVS